MQASDKFPCELNFGQKCKKLKPVFPAFNKKEI